MKPLVLKPINTMVAPTWHRLAVNSSSLEIPEHFQQTHNYKLHCDPILMGPQDAFTQALDGLQLRTFGTAQAACSLEAAEAQVFSEQNSNSDDYKSILDSHALSDFQAHSQAVEATRSIYYAFETGMGKQAFNYLRQTTPETLVIQTAPGVQDSEIVLIVSAQEHTVNTCALDVIVADKSSCRLNIVFEGDAVAEGILGISTRIFVGRQAKLHLTTTQALPDGVTTLNDIGAVLDTQASLLIEQNELGSANAFGGCAVDLRGEESSAHLTVRYIGQRQQKRDFNYLMRHHGKNTESSMQANGVLADKSQKTLRGTIDFVTGCKGSEASELESVILADKTAVNRTVPVILCSEDDVAGNHGATIGSMNPEQLFYFESHGISAEQAQAMLLRATVENAYLSAKDPYSQTAIAAFGKKHFTHFEDLLD